jgi:hypothetical protein
LELESESGAERQQIFFVREALRCEDESDTVLREIGRIKEISVKKEEKEKEKQTEMVEKYGKCSR